MDSLLDGPKQFAKDSLQLLNRCTKPDKKGKKLENPEQKIANFRISIIIKKFPVQKWILLTFFCLEYIKISRAVGFGFFVMGLVGFIVKLIHIPINNILV